MIQGSAPPAAPIGTAVLHPCLDPRDGFLIDKIVAPVKSVDMRKDENLLPSRNLGAVVEQIIDGDRCAFGDSYGDAHGKCSPA